MSDSEGETIHSVSEISEDESSYNTSDENFINDAQTLEEEYLPPKRKSRKQKIDKIEIKINF